MEYAIEMLNITKEFPGILANDNVTLKIKKNTIHALLGENGAGKSTIMSILFGLYQPTKGSIKINGKTVVISNPNIANELGIGMVHQHFKLVDCYTVTENIILGIEPHKYGMIDLHKANEKVKQISELYGLNVDPTALIKNISVGMQQRVEILKMLYRNANILIFDEPTAVLTPQEIEELKKIFKKLINEGKTILLITHKLKEIKAIADECSILRKGKYIGTIDVSKTSENEMASMMVGREIQFTSNKIESKPTDIVLDIQHLYVKGNKGNYVINDFNLRVKAGEIVGLAGIDGNGQTELVYALTGLTKIEKGTVLLNGKDISHLPIKQRLDSGLSHVPEDRHRHGLILDFNLKENFIIHQYNKIPFSKNGILNEKEIDLYAEKLIEQFDIRAALGKDTNTRSMSGGNQQKAIIAREIDRSSDLLLVVQPTRGLDVGAIEYIHSRIIQERDAKKAVLLVSFELDEIMNLSDKIAVIHNGHLTGFMKNNETDEKEIGLMMTGSIKRVEALYEKN